MWTIQLLGGLSVDSPQRQITRFRTQKAASLLAFLAFYTAFQPRETLCDMLWPEAEPEVGRHNLSNALSFLRHVLEPPGVPPGTVILADRASVRLNPAAVRVDVIEFESELDKASRTCSRVCSFRRRPAPGLRLRGVASLRVSVDCANRCAWARANSA